MTPAELLGTYRREMDDTVQRYLWSDDDVFGYIDDAQRRFCQLTRGISDATSVACTVALTAGEPFSALHPSIRQIRSAQLASTGRSLQILDLEQAAALRRDDYGAHLTGGLTLLPGPVWAGVIGVEDSKIRWVDVPEADDTAQLVIYRSPLRVVAESSAELPLEVSDDYSDALLYWARHRGYLKHDVETFDQKQADRFEAKFIARCAEIRRDQERRVHTARTVAYGGL